jgi:hypothetical protein
VLIWAGSMKMPSVKKFKSQTIVHHNEMVRVARRLLELYERGDDTATVCLMSNGTSYVMGRSEGHRNSRLKPRAR